MATSVRSLKKQEGLLCKSRRHGLVQTSILLPCNQCQAVSSSLSLLQAQGGAR